MARIRFLDPNKPSDKKSEDLTKTVRKLKKHRLILLVITLIELGIILNHLVINNL